MRAFWTDFNDPKGLASVRWWEPEVAVGEKIVLTDGDADVVCGEIMEVVRQPDREARKEGFIYTTYDRSTWVDGEIVLALAVDYAAQATRANVARKIQISPVAAEDES